MSAHSQPHTQDAGPVVDGELVPDGPLPAPVSLELARRERRNEVTRPLDVEQLVESFAAYQALIPRLLDDSDYQGTGTERFKKKSAWRKLATAFDLDVTLIADEVERDYDGTPLRAKVIARAIAPSGRTMDGDGYCSADEPRFASDRGRQKLENDLRATASTRAKNRAISDLIGAGEVSAEEVDAGAAAAGASTLPWGPRLADKALARAASQALEQLVGPTAESVWKAIVERCGYMPLAIAIAYIDLVRPPEREEAQAV